MDIDGGKVRSERLQRAWSQEQLAEVAGLSLRTVQRVEAQGAASYETAKSLAAAFGMAVPSLRLPGAASPPHAVQPSHRLRFPRWATAGVALGAGGVLAGVALFAGRAMAGEVMMNVGITADGKAGAPVQLIAGDGQEAEFRLDDQWRVVLVPTAQAGGRIAIVAQVWVRKEGRLAPMAAPKVVARDGELATITVDDPAGKLELQLRAHKL